MGRRAMGRCRSRPSVGRRPRHAHRPLAGAHPRAHRHGRGIAIPQSAARAGSAAPSRRRSSISVAAERAKLSAAALFAATISAARDAVSGGAGTRRDRRCTGTGHAIVGAAVRTGHRRRSSCLSVTARRCLRSEPQSECAWSAATARQQHRCQRAAARRRHDRAAAPGGCSTRSFQPLGASDWQRQSIRGQHSATLAADQSQRHRRHT